ncbi:hypothetical protein CgunFtcFv8_023767 [Champsocephalus gunnari]|uniref:Uncharacterized protein n=1 Tax=Champsocephalus gunnari TaxID=52237 RepID=A0AAN8HKN6_CHAGU|nr:hypothetical protein CgunFtcFv8_023767 [Champsocephalus gunnari]
MLSDHDQLDNLETEEEERERLSQMEGSSNMNKCLPEKQHKKAVSQSFNGNSSVMDNSMDNFIVTKKKKRAAVIESKQEITSNMEESTSESELASDEQMDQCTAGGVKLSSNGILSEEESFGALVRRGKEYQSRGKPDDALGCFLRAIDIQPGDSEVQLMTIQLYRQLSQRS